MLGPCYTIKDEMTKKSTIQEMQDFVSSMIQKDGKVYCPECSNGNWKVYHEPGKHIKEESNAKSESEDREN